ncbi:hypothetical protein FXV83_06510 [Bradyrhizobium hipponense]|uniref:Uncharacterized protein n=1 Tax=Bradyrhizobium hipponense TaxID=2605638 RepID=A0A5S4YUB2_9BRAD|nr:hypothetical protein [Bradyrhizobium hipponense]TYO67264.1 hypothetical protein FXV83_06510 [Bradyrhizobium hipponense]
MTVVFAWICAGVAAVATLGAAYFFDRSAEEGIERARHEAAAANERAAALERDATAARLQIAQAQARALEAQAELAKYKAPRSLSVTQRDELAKALAPFRKHMNVGVSSQDQEALDFAEQIAGAAIAAGWTIQRTVWDDHLRVSGVEIHAITEGITEEDRTAGLAVATSLQKSGFRVTQRDRQDIGNPTFHIYLIVGRKPT